MSNRADQITRATRMWGVAFNASRVEASLARLEEGEPPDESERERYKLIADFFQRALDGFSVMKALIEDNEVPKFNDTSRRIDDFRFAARVLPEDVQDPGALLALHRDRALAFAENRASNEMIRPTREVAQRIREFALGAAQEIRAGLA